MRLFGDRYRGRRVLVTGHTGFKGSWLASWLQALGAEAVGIALAPATEPSHWNLLRLAMPDHRADIRDGAALAALVRSCAPEIVFHLAAQPLVRRSYRDPLETWSTNVVGTANLLEACRQAASVRAIVVVTSDKCYENRGASRPYAEGDPLGGHDPYSASKAAAELVAASYRDAFFHGPEAPLVATARAGNVIGGGDWAEDRLVPDLVRAVAAGRSLEIRYPEATRPWQHVLESLGGYLLLGQRLLEGAREMAQAWNFGPLPESQRSVADVIEGLARHWPALSWHATAAPQPHEARQLQLDISKARERLGWTPVWNFEETLDATGAWYRGFLASGAIASRAQLTAYAERARALGHEWASA